MGIKSGFAMGSRENNLLVPSTESSEPGSPSGSGPSSINTLMIALTNMKDRCSRMDKRIQDLEKENLQLRSSRSELYRDVKKLHEANIKLREKNLALNQKLHRKNKENVDVRDQLNSLQDQHSDSIRQLERLQDEVTAIAVNRSRESGLLSNGSNSLEEDMSPMSLEEQGDGEAESLSETEAQLVDMKVRLLQQQATIKAAMKQMQQQIRHREEEQRRSGSVGDSATPSSSVESRTCPMCEAAFHGDVGQDAFEAHVVEHFNYEESETLRNFDMVPDAQF